LLGEVKRGDVPDLLAAADIFLQTSIYEGQSNSILEALHARVPIVAHDIPEQRETLVEADGSLAGVLVPMDNLEAWLAAIERLRSDPALVESTRKTASRRAQLFCYEAMIAGFERSMGISKI
jgi:glycosyltransferase involved in cell wall biosynthesis